MIKQENGVYCFTTISAIADGVMFLLFMGGAAAIWLGYDMEELDTLSTVGIGVACIIVGVLLLTVFKFTKLVSEVREEGIIERASKVSKGLIRWEEIEDVRLYKLQALEEVVGNMAPTRRRSRTETTFIGIFLVDVEAYSKKLNIIQKGIMNTGLKMGYAPINIPLNQLGEDADEFVAICKSLLEKKRAKTAG